MTTPTPDVDPALVELLARHGQVRYPATGAAYCPCGWTGPFTMNADKLGFAAHLATVLEPHIQQRVRDALEGAGCIDAGGCTCEPVAPRWPYHGGGLLISAGCPVHNEAKP